MFVRPFQYLTLFLELSNLPGFTRQAMVRNRPDTLILYREVPSVWIRPWTGSFLFPIKEL